MLGRLGGKASMREKPERAKPVVERDDHDPLLDERYRVPVVALSAETPARAGIETMTGALIARNGRPAHRR